MSLPVIMHARVVAGRGGGPEKTILNSPRFLQPRGFDSVCLYLRDPVDSGFEFLEQQATSKSAGLVTVDDFGIFDVGILKRVKNAVLEHRPAVWHGHDYKSNLLGLIARRYHPMRLVTTVHGWVHRTWKTPLYYFIDRRCLPKYDHVICVSQDLYQDCQRIGVAADRLVKIDNAIALDDYEIDQTSDRAKASLNFDRSAPLIAGVGRLSAEKCFDHLIDAVVQCNERFGETPMQLAIAGEGAEKVALQDRIDHSGMGDRIRLIGFMKDPRVLYRAADLFVLSSKREGLPNVVLEAMAMRTPVVSTRVAGIPSLIDDGVQGELIDAEQTSQIVQAITRFQASPSTFTTMADAAHDRIARQFSFGGRMDQIAHVYRSLL